MITINWKEHLGKWSERKDFMKFMESLYMKKLLLQIIKSSKTKTIYPPREDVFKAFRLCPPNNLKVVILGQDPYHDGSAIGLAFGNSNEKTRLSPSLRKILQCVEKQYNVLKIDEDPSLQMWAEQGVLLLNTALTVEKGAPESHLVPWQPFTKFVIKYIAENFPGTIFMLWGAKAQKFTRFDDVDLTKNCHVLKAVHPSYANFKHFDWECDNFKKANEIIKGQNGKEYCIKW